MRVDPAPPVAHLLKWRVYWLESAQYSGHIILAAGTALPSLVFFGVHIVDEQHRTGGWILHPDLNDEPLDRCRCNPAGNGRV